MKEPAWGETLSCLLANVVFAGMLWGAITEGPRSDLGLFVFLMLANGVSFSLGKQVATERSKPR